MANTKSFLSSQVSAALISQANGTLCNFDHGGLKKGRNLMILNSIFNVGSDPIFDTGAELLLPMDQSHTRPGPIEFKRSNGR